LAEQKRILIVKLGAVGDCLHAMIALRVLRRHLPNAVLGWVVETKSEQVVAGNPDLNHLHVWRRKETSRLLKEGRLGAAWRSIHEVVEEIREVGYDTAIDFQNLFKSGFFARRSGAITRIGFARLREANFLFTNRRVQPRPDEIHMVRRYLALLRPLGIEENGFPPAVPVVVPKQDHAVIDEFFAAKVPEGRPVVAFNPAASLPRKLWPAQRFAEVADRLAETHRIVPLVIWGPGEEGLVAEFRSHAKSPVWTAPRTTLKELAYLLARCTLYVGNDSGPMHLAAAMGCAVVGLFGPTDPRRVAPWTPRAVCVEPGEPFSKTRRVDGIVGEQVVRAATSLLEAR